MPNVAEQIDNRTQQIDNYLNSSQLSPLFLIGDSLKVLKGFPDNSVDCCITSPPYWGKREYESGGLGLEDTYESYTENLTSILLEVKRVLKSTGSLWLNLGDSYVN